MHFTIYSKPLRLVSVWVLHAGERELIVVEKITDPIFLDFAGGLERDTSPAIASGPSMKGNWENACQGTASGDAPAFSHGDFYELFSMRRLPRSSSA